MCEQEVAHGLVAVDEPARGTASYSGSRLTAGRQGSAGVSKGSVEMSNRRSTRLQNLDYASSLEREELARMDEVLGELPDGSLYRRVVECRRGMLEEGISLIEAATMPGTNRPGLGRGIKAGRPRRIHPEVEALIVLRRWEGASIRRITAELDAAGLPTPGNRSWQYSTVQRVIDRHPELASAPTAPRRRRSR